MVAEVRKSLKPGPQAHAPRTPGHPPPIWGPGDRELARLSRGADAQPCGQLVQRAAPSVRRLLRRMGAESAAADDLTQDARVAALRSIGQYRGDAPFASWVSRIAGRLYMKRCRKEAR
jgi:DNA-directed RNA polymerase specialized sigma24 family protein